MKSNMKKPEPNFQVMDQSRIYTGKGTHREVGIAIGKAIGERFETNINQLISVVDQIYGINFDKLERESMIWFENLPVQYQAEFEGIAHGSGVSIEKLAQWCYSDRAIDGGCTSFITRVEEELWVGRNNDYIMPEAWGHLSMIQVNGKIPVMLFGLEGEVFSGTGYNAEQIWIHYNWLPVWDQPHMGKDVISPFVWIRLALESCKTIADVEHLLRNTTRDGGMNLFVVDGKRNELAVFECTCTGYQRRSEREPFIAAANHYCVTSVPNGFGMDFTNSQQRQTRVEELLQAQNGSVDLENIINILADDQVEQRGELSGTVYSNVACPGRDQVWFAYDGFPAASESNWKQVTWNW